MFQYAQDYDEKFPVSEAAYRFPTGQQSSWDLVLQPYIKSYQILKCPSDPAGGVNVPGFSDNMVRSYAVAAYMWEDQESISPVTGLNARLGGRHLAGLPAPAMTLMMADAPSCNGGPSNPNAGTSDWHQCVGIIATDGWATNRNSRPFWGAGAGAEGLHLGTVNLLYADGHVKAKKASTGSAMLDKSAGGHPDTVGPIPPGYSWIWAEADLPKG
jgi:prepilin-type processing-associated H-X9-DG protein